VANKQLTKCEENEDISKRHGNTFSGIYPYVSADNKCEIKVDWNISKRNRESEMLGERPPNKSMLWIQKISWKVEAIVFTPISIDDNTKSCISLPLTNTHEFTLNLTVFLH